MARRRRRFAEYYDSGRYQGVSELHVCGAKAVNLQERHVLGEIAAYGDTVIHVHKFRGNQPDGKPLLFHPVVAQQEKIAVQSGKTADVEV